MIWWTSKQPHPIDELRVMAYVGELRRLFLEWCCTQDEYDIIAEEIIRVMRRRV